MPNTQGFEIVAEVTVGALREVLNQAWKSGSDDSGEGVIFEHIEIPEDISFGPYQIKDGTIQIPQDQLGLDMDTSINGVDVKLGTIVQVEIKNPPIESAKSFDMTADIHIHSPVAALEEGTEVGLILNDLPGNAVEVTITSGDPIGSIKADAVAEYVHQRFKEDTFQKIIDPIPLSFPPFSMKGRVELYDDDTDPTKQITVELPVADKVKVLVPCYIRFYDIEGSFAGFSLESPMGIKGIIEVLADYEETEGQVTAKLSTAQVDLTNVLPVDAPAIEGQNYTSNKTLANLGGYDLEQIIIAGFKVQGTAELQNLGDAVVVVPTLSQIEDFIEEQVRIELNIRKQISVWKPETPDDGSVEINDVTPQALADALAIGLNAGPGANPGALVNFIPADREFATAISAAKVLAEINKAVQEEFGDLPHTFNDINGHDANSKFFKYFFAK